MRIFILFLYLRNLDWNRRGILRWSQVCIVVNNIGTWNNWHAWPIEDCLAESNEHNDSVGLRTTYVGTIVMVYWWRLFSASGMLFCSVNARGKIIFLRIAMRHDNNVFFSLLATFKYWGVQGKRVVKQEKVNHPSHIDNSPILGIHGLEFLVVGLRVSLLWCLLIILEWVLY